MKSFVVIFVSLFCVVARAGFLDGLKKIGSGVAETVNGAVDATVASSTNLYKSVKNETVWGDKYAGSQSTTNKIETIHADDHLPKTATVQVFKSGDELAVAYLKGEFKEKADRLLEQDSNRYRNSYAQLWSYVNPDKGRGRSAYGSMRRVWARENTGVPNLIQAGGGANVPTELQQAERWVADVKIAMASEEANLTRTGNVSASGKVAKISNRADDGRAVLNQTSRRNRDLPAGRDNSYRSNMGISRSGRSVGQMQSANSEEITKYKAFIMEIERVGNEIKDTRKLIRDNKEYQSVKTYYVTARGKYETCKVSSDVVTLTIRDVPLKSQLLPDCEMPAKQAEFVIWTNEILSVMNGDLSAMHKVVERRNKYYKFLVEWENLQNEYEKLMVRFGKQELSLLNVSQSPEDNEEISNEINPSISHRFGERLKQLDNARVLSVNSHRFMLSFQSSFTLR